MTELSPSGAARETARGIAIGVLLSSGIMAILVLAGAYKILEANNLSVLLAPLSFAVGILFMVSASERDSNLQPAPKGD